MRTGSIQHRAAGVSVRAGKLQYCVIIGGVDKARLGPIAAVHNRAIERDGALVLGEIKIGGSGAQRSTHRKATISNGSTDDACNVPGH